MATCGDFFICSGSFISTSIFFVNFGDELAFFLNSDLATLLSHALRVLALIPRKIDLSAKFVETRSLFGCLKNHS